MMIPLLTTSLFERIMSFLRYSEEIVFFIQKPILSFLLRPDSPLPRHRPVPDVSALFPFLGIEGLIVMFNWVESPLPQLFYLLRHLLIVFLFRWDLRYPGKMDSAMHITDKRYERFGDE